MKKLIVATLLLSIIVAESAFAGGYSAAVERQEFCDHIGGVSKNVYDGKQAGSTKQHFIDMGARASAVDPTNAKLIKFAINYGYDEATDGKDAYMKSWAYCMDSI